jgi:hypothetical protein
MSPPVFFPRSRSRGSASSMLLPGGLHLPGPGDRVMFDTPAERARDAVHPVLGTHAGEIPIPSGPPQATAQGRSVVIGQVNDTLLPVEVLGVQVPMPRFHPRRPQGAGRLTGSRRQPSHSTACPRGAGDVHEPLGASAGTAGWGLVDHYFFVRSDGARGRMREHTGRVVAHLT